MAATKITTYTEKEITTLPFMQIVSCTTITNGDWFISKFNSIQSVQVTGRAHVAYVASISGNKITLECTGGDVVDLIIVGS